ncbi:hypothetical protein CHARACLAT_026554 [Characodon lateralis]|uniref:Uncharacterized protein n=1 Tax=Characodon lateralis TaxID=208331 RepID=A0ABU7DDY4_9TELE|nr:hypothetical protein [Characodon lateralis]
MRRNNSRLFNFTERHWDSLEQASCIELLQDPDVRYAVKRVFSGNVQLPRLSCRPAAQERPRDGALPEPPARPTRSIRHSRSLGTLTSWVTGAYLQQS